MRKRYIVRTIMSLLVILICIGVQFLEFDESWLFYVGIYAATICGDSLYVVVHNKHRDESDDLL